MSYYTCEAARSIQCQRYVWLHYVFII